MIDNNINNNINNPIHTPVMTPAPMPEENFFNPRNIAIGVVILLVVVALSVLGVKYYKANQKAAEEPTEDTGALPEAGDLTGGVTSGSTQQAVVTAPKPEMSTADKTKFSTLLANGTKAFSAKNYAEALKNYNEALTLSDSDVVYIRLHSVYSAQGNNAKALEMLNTAIAKNPEYTDYWTTKLTFLDQKTDSSFADLQAVYQEGLTKVDPRTKINLVTHFARIAESAGNYAEAVSIFEYAKTVYPKNANVYQAEIDRLTSTTK